MGNDIKRYCDDRMTKLEEGQLRHEELQLRQMENLTTQISSLSDRVTTDLAHRPPVWVTITIGILMAIIGSLARWGV